MISASSDSHAQLQPKVSVAIGSWTDSEYKGLLYPKGLPDNQRLSTYATWFNHVEVNSSYHRIPPRSFTQNWVKQTPDDFLFDFKLSKDFSTNPEATARGGTLVTQLLRAVEPIVAAGKLGTFFLVLPPSFEPGKDRLEELEPLIARLHPHMLAVELRHRGWVEGDHRERTLEFFRMQKLVWIAVDMPRVEESTIMPPVDEVTNSKLAYLRLHGRRSDWMKLKSQEEKHTYEYSDEELKEIADRVKTLEGKAETVHVVANNHAQDFAPKAALALQKILRIRKREPLSQAPAGTSTGHSSSRRNP